ncbi:MAG: phosphomannomutase [Parcubacteria group bacterium Athens1014_10]|nr:MAG: phosphomannomutase [Parcubacteria group bacterium Athens1014_10]TSD04690.1 MAG: phosphomannomutase [Parcubacteria group bacterium Athens0714_12]
MKINPKIFQTNDIRGLYPQEVNEKFAYLLGKAIVKISKAKTIVIGGDKRASSKILFKALSRGVIDYGAEVIDIGKISTPIFYFAVAEHRPADAGVMITASHLTNQYNGFKMVDNKSMSLDIKQRIKIKKLIEKENFKSLKKKGNIIKENAFDNYCQKKISLIKTPMAELNEMAKKIKFAIKYDTDKDRIMFFDEKKEKIPGDLITALLAKYILKNNKGEKIVITSNSSKIVREEIEKAGGKPIVSKIGHYFLKKKMVEEKAIFGGEISGHYYFKDFYFCECPDLVLLKVLEIIKKEKKTLRELIKPFKKYCHSGEINFKIRNKEKKINEIKKYFKESKKSFLDGLTCEFEDWWFNLRTSNTENILRLTLEAKDKKLMEEKIIYLKKFIKN